MYISISRLDRDVYLLRFVMTFANWQMYLQVRHLVEGYKSVCKYRRRNITFNSTGQQQR